MAKPRFAKKSKSRAVRRYRNTLARRFRKGQNRVPRSLGVTVPQYCKIQETIEYNELKPNTSYYMGFTIAQFARASQIAINFRFFKPTKIIWSYEPKFNTFQELTTGDTVGMPYLYVIMNRTQDNHPYSLQDIQAQGARPQKFTGTKSVSYRPNWCSPGLLVNNTINVNQGTPPPAAVSNIAFMGLKAEYGWQQCPTDIPTADDTVTPSAPATQPNLPGAGTGQVMTPNYAGNCMYNGHDLYISQDNAVGEITVCKVTATVIWEFKGANQENNQSIEQVIKVIKPHNHISHDGL